ncbi:hypothetical protein R1flu_026351 [Riccia fluitans]|uniref:Fungal lipase-type domain-containing protein n=1 Tax=Riccia fluitans TaxID=41844 RepID=A0ABD1XFP8_9MARC
MATSVVSHVGMQTIGGVSLHSGCSAEDLTRNSKFVSFGNSRSGLSRRLQFSQKLTPLQVRRAGDHQHHSFTVSIRCSSDATPTPRSTVTRAHGRSNASSTPLQVRTAPDQAQLVQDLQSNLASSPERTYLDKQHPYAHLHVGDSWREIQGSCDWEGLLDDMDPVLQGKIIRYGEFAQATYDAFDNDHHSKFCGSSKYNKKKLLKEVGLENRGYEITDYIYATADTHLPKVFKNLKHDDSWSKDSNFMGFVAVCTSPQEVARLGRHDVLVAWRGTVTKFEWLENVRDFFSPTGLNPRGSSDVMVESGFLSIYKSANENSRYNKLSAQQQVLAAVRRQVRTYKHEEMSIMVTGHSLGSALSTICAYDIVESGINKRADSPKVPKAWNSAKPGNHHDECPCDNPVPVSVFSFTGPRVGNSAFKRRLEELGVKVLRVVNKHDKVTKVPGIIFNEKLEFLHRLCSLLPCSYHHVGTELELDSLDSEFLKPTTDPLNAHNLEAYLHLLDGYNGDDKKFSSALGRYPALVNKASDFLKSELGILPFWWQEENKGLLKDEAGRWTVQSRSDEDFSENQHLD